MKDRPLKPVVIIALGLAVLAAFWVGTRKPESGTKEGFAGLRGIDPNLIQRPLRTPGPEKTARETPEPTPEPTPQEETAEVVADEKPTEPEPIELAMRQPPGAVHGWVETLDGVPVGGAEVRLEFEKLIKDGKKGPGLKGISGTDGRFAIMNVPPGPWTAVAEKTGFSIGTAAGIQVASELATLDVELVLQPAVKLGGVVKSGTKQVLSGARVEVARPVLSVPRADGTVVRRDVFYRSIETDSNGRFLLEAIAPGANIVTASLDGYAPERTEYTVPDNGKEDMEITLYSSAPVGGTVRNEEGRVLSGATVELSDPQDKKISEKVQTGERGEFLFRNLRADRSYVLQASATNYAPSPPITVDSGRLTTVIVLTTGGAISGTVRRLDTGHEAPNIPLLLKSATEGEILQRRTASDSNGVYVFPDLPSGSYNVYVQSESLTSEPKLGVNVKIPQETRDIDFTVYPGEEIRGVVLESQSGERVFAATVKLESQVGPGFLTDQKSSATTDDLGEFRFRNLPRGFYELEASKEDYLRYPGPEARVSVRLIPGEVQEPVTLLLSRGGTITGTVVGPEDGPVQDAVVQLFNAPGARYKIKTDKLATKTDAGGRFRISGIPLDNQVDVVASGYVSGLAKGKSDPISITEFLPSVDVLIRLEVGSNVTVRVVDEENDFHIHGATVSLSHNSFRGDRSPESWRGETGTDGSFTFGNVPPGSASVSASKSGYINAGRGFTVAENEPVEVELELTPGTAIRGIVLDDAGVPIQKGRVRAWAESGARGGGNGNIGPDGRFAIESVSKGTFRLRAEAIRSTPSGDHKVLSEIDGAVSGTTEHRIVVPMTGSIEGTVFDFETVEPVAGARAAIDGRYEYKQGRKTTFSAQMKTTADGVFSFQSIPPATYRLRISASGYLPETLEDIDVYSRQVSYVGKTPLRKGSVVRGRIVSASNGEAIVGATVRFPEAGEKGRSGKTNGRGEFRISSVPPGVYTMTVSHGRYLPLEKSLVQVLDRESDQDLGEIEMEPGGTIEGRVLDETRKPVTGASVIVRSNESDERRNAATNGKGIVRVEGLKAGGYSVTVTGKFPRGKVTKSVSLDVARNDTETFEMTLGGNLTLTGRLFGPPGVLVRPQLTVYPVEPNGNPVVGGRIDAAMKGISFEVNDLVEGGYLLAASATVNGQPSYWHRVIQLDPPGGTADVVAGGASIGGRVYSREERINLPNVSVRLRALTFPQSGTAALNSWWEWNTRTDDAGRWRVRGLHPGTYEIVASEQGSPEATPDIVTLGPWQELSVTVVLGEEAVID